MLTGNFQQFLFFFFAIFICSASTYPPVATDNYQQSEVYEMLCEIYLDNGIKKIEVHYNDDDYDCVSDDWYAIYHYKDGRSQVMLSDEFSDNLEQRKIDFNTWGCCHLP